MADALNQCFYVDDFLGGANSITEARQIVKDLCQQLSDFGFELRKWTSSHPELTAELPLELRGTSDQLELFSKEYKTKALGICWKPNADTFVFSIELSHIEQHTKRALLSDSSKVFDPMGWIGPVIIVFKCLIQQTWVEGLSWDEELPIPITKRWIELREELKLLNDLEIPRCVIPTTEHEKHLHVFCDASEKAYAAVVYVRTETTDGGVHVWLLTSKTRVAPVKQLSTPRLELCAAQLGANLVHNLSVSLQIHNVFAWTDNTIVLSWLSKLPRTWNTFVANRVSNIQEVLPRKHWDHVPTDENPADIASRGTTVSHLLPNNLWWRGPSWLSTQKQNWPHFKPTSEEVPEKREFKEILTVSVASPIIEIDRFSSFSKLCRVFAMVKRFVAALKKNHDNLQLPITSLELSDAKHSLISLEQNRFFRGELKLLKDEQQLSKSSNLRNLCPFYDPDYNALRVGGRLGNSSYHELKKFPFLIPTNSHLAPLLVRHFHEETLHGGGQMTQAALREHFWIVGVKPLINKTIQNCLNCCRYSLKAPFQLMADLPAERVTPVRPFSLCGLDFAGPFITKLPECEGQKRYIALFVCFVTKAVHLELVSSLTKEACIMALKRFASRRGTPTKLFSDNGLNFIGARNELLKLEEVLASRDEESVFAYANQKGSQWIVIPPRAPHFGGLWEAGIKSMKRHLRRVVGQQKLTNEEFLTVLHQVEAVMNSRPLTPLSSRPNDLTPLSPAHFLIGGPFSPQAINDQQCTWRTRFRLIQQIQKDFWDAWKRDYLTILQVRKKWFTNGPEIKCGDLVLLAEDNLKPLQWKTGRVVEVYAVNDSVTRVVKVKTSAGDIIRPVVKL